MTQESKELCNPSNEVTRGQRHRRSVMGNCKLYAPTYVLLKISLYFRIESFYICLFHMRPNRNKQREMVHVASDGEVR